MGKYVKLLSQSILSTIFLSPLSLSFSLFLLPLWDPLLSPEASQGMRRLHSGTDWLVYSHKASTKSPFPTLVFGPLWNTRDILGPLGRSGESAHMTPGDWPIRRTFVGVTGESFALTVQDEMGVNANTALPAQGSRYTPHLAWAVEDEWQHCSYSFMFIIFFLFFFELWQLTKILSVYDGFGKLSYWW